MSPGRPTTLPDDAAPDDAAPDDAAQGDAAPDQTARGSTVLGRIAPRPVPVPRSARVEQIVAAAGDLVDAEGPTALSMRRLADELGIKAPSLYKHLPGRDAVVALVVDDALVEWGEALHAAVDDAPPGSAGTALVAEYRRLGRARPHRYRLATDGALPRDGLTPGLEGWAGEPFFRVTGEPYRAQALWAFTHGTLTLEIDGRFMPGSDLELTWRAGVDALTTPPR